MKNWKERISLVFIIIAVCFLLNYLVIAIHESEEIMREKTRIEDSLKKLKLRLEIQNLENQINNNNKNKNKNELTTKYE